MEAPNKDRTERRGPSQELRRLHKLDALCSEMEPGEADRALAWLADNYGTPRKTMNLHPPYEGV